MSANVVPFNISVQSAETQRGFKSFKSLRPIPYTRRCCRDALIQAALDPEVVRLFSCDSPWGTPQDTFFTFGAQIAERKCLLALCEDTNAATFSPPEGFTLGFCLNRETILSEPILTTSRTVWSKREVLVPPLFSIRLLKRLAKHSAGIALGELEDYLTDESTRWVDYVLAMACSGLVTIDCRHPLTHATLVKMGTAWGERSSTHWLY